MQPDFVTIHRRASIAMDTMKNAKRKSIYAAFERLRALPPKRWKKAGVDLLEPDEEGLFCMLVPPNLNVFFKVTEPNQFEIQDIIPQETIDLVRRQESMGQP